jgi:glyceraldehyde 3-phosphate dehydrogenase
MPSSSAANAHTRVDVANGGVRVGINGFGRIGRLFFRAAEASSSNIDVVAINDPSLPSVEYAAYVLTRDSTYGRFPGTVDVETVERETTLMRFMADPAGAGCTKYLRVDGRRILVTHERDPKNVPWYAQDVSVVVDASGKFLTAETAGAHLGGTTDRDSSSERTYPSKVVLTAPPKDDVIPTYVVGVNEGGYVKDGFPNVVSNASCTTNCLAPLAKIIDDAFGIESGAMTTVHALTISQPTVDGHCEKDWARGRSGLQNIVPTTSGAAKSLGKVLPALQGKVTGYALRVPVADVSVVDFTVNIKQPASFEAVCAAVKHAAANAMRGIVASEDAPCVSSDFIGNPASCVFDASASFQVSPTCHKLVAWYDNEYAYACRVVDLVQHVARSDGDASRLEALLAEKKRGDAGGGGRRSAASA